MVRLKNIDDLRTLRVKLSSEVFPQGKDRARVCCGTACTASGSARVIDALVGEARKRGVDVEIIKTGCQGMCQRGPIMKVEPHEIFYERVRPEQVPPLIDHTFLSGTPYRQALYREDILSEPTTEMLDLPFYKKQVRIALRNNVKIDPTNIYHYIAVGGYAGIEKALSSMTPDDVLHEVDHAILRGRGGAGFPAGKKWHHTKSAPGKIKFVIANGDEGDPGAFMDRSIMEGDPHSLFEGMLLCAYAIGAQYGFVYVRHEYPLAVKNLKHAIKQAEELGLLGKNILGTDFSFHLDVREGAGAFVCGESTSLVASIEGERGFPRPRPPRLSEPGGGVWGYPSNLNNIETYACVAPIIEKGAEWFRSIGTKTSPGTKVFALTGKVKNTGLVEVPMGMTLREIIFDIGGGILHDKAIKAVQTGGPSGGCIPAHLLDLPADFDSLTKAGSMMGSGGMVVMDEETCMVDVAKYFLSFSLSESCGKCPPCRLGTYQMFQILERITQGKGQDGDLQRLYNMGKQIQRGSLCGLGQSAPNPVLSTIKYFRDEYEEHIYGKYCRANVCGGMGVFTINSAECFSCGLCKAACAYGAVKETRSRYFIDQDACAKCKACYAACPIGAVKIRKQSIVRLEEQFRVPIDKIEILERRAKMTLRDLIAAKPMKIVTCNTSCIVADAVTIMDGNNVGSILVYDENKKLAGIFTERDIMHCFAKNVSFKEETMEKVMSRDPVILDASTDISVAVTVMSEKKIRHLPVLEGGKIIGMVSYRDLVSYLLPEVIYMAEDIY
ncbi:MAG TPA: NADH-ubiquinone oxidoreductase-F iron-sulfur binding region domain-containing protein [Thermodesulfovibrionales bacterium]|nr:NADH-ubiquinone oxidoreductase-F iron-sulfur binding region domain-containing protein [Thermodesulfovibrionales bacterium]